ncbi:MAG: DUF58 domain-containing protein [Pyrobaculum sp.]|uniref:DUF58 domain-containing protein n=2 Tax=Pyrobaculum sp. TaxID=2004705 RepID=UPI003167D673
MRRLIYTAALLLGIGSVLGSREVALLSLAPLAAFAINAALPPPGVAAEARRAGSFLEVAVRTGGLPGIVVVWVAPRLGSAIPSARVSMFAAPLKRTLKLRIPISESPAYLVVESYNAVFTKRAAAVYVAGARPTEPLQLAKGAEEFHEVRPYQPGDAPRFINWRLYAKTGDLYINKYAGAEELRAVVVLDTRRMAAAVADAAQRAASVLAERGFSVTYYVPGVGVVDKASPAPGARCGGAIPCGDVTVYVGSLSDMCRVGCPSIVYIDVAGEDPLAAIRRLPLYRELRASGAVVLTRPEDLRQFI